MWAVSILNTKKNEEIKQKIMAKHKKPNPPKIKTNTNDTTNTELSQSPLLSQKFLDFDLSALSNSSEHYLKSQLGKLSSYDQVEISALLELGETVSRYLNDNTDDKLDHKSRIPVKFDSNDMSFFNEKFMAKMKDNLNSQHIKNDKTKKAQPNTKQLNTNSGSIKLSNVSSYSIFSPEQQHFFEAITGTEPLDKISLVMLEAFQRVFYELYEMSKFHNDIVELTLYWRLYLLMKKGNSFYSLFTNMIVFMINKGMSSFELLEKITNLLSLSPALKEELSTTYKDIVETPLQFGLGIYSEKLKGSKNFNPDEFYPANNKCFLLTLIDLTPILFEPNGIKLLCFYSEYSLIMTSQDWSYDEVTEFSPKQIGIPKHERLFEFAEAQFATANSILENGMKQKSDTKPASKNEDNVNNNENKVIATVGGKKITQKTLDSRALTLKNTYKELSKEEREKLLNITREDVFRVFSRSEIKGQISSSEMSGFHAFAKRATEKIGDDYNVDACDCCSGGKHFDYEVNGRKIYEALFKSEKMKDEDLTDAEFNLRILNDETFIMKKQKTEENKRKGITEEKSDDSNLPSYNSSAKSSILSDIFVNSFNNQEDNNEENAMKLKTEPISNAIQSIPSFSSSSPPVFKEEQYKKLAATEKITNWLSENILIKNFLKRTFRLLPMVEIAENILSSSLYESDEHNSQLFFSLEVENLVPSIFSQNGQPYTENLLQLKENDHVAKEVFTRSKKMPLNNEFSADTFYETLKNNITLEKFDDLLDKTYVDESDRIVETEVTDDDINFDLDENIGYTNLKKISEIVWDDNSSTIKNPNTYLKNQFISLSSKSNDVNIDFSSFNKHMDEFKEYLDEENKEEFEEEIVELQEFTEKDVGNVQGKVDVDYMFNLAKQMFFKDKVVTIDYESFINDLIEDDLNELVIPEEEKKLRTISLTSPFKETSASTMLKDLYLSKGFDENAKFDVKVGNDDGIETHFFTFTNSYNGKRFFFHKNFHTSHVNGLMKRYSNSGLITDEGLEKLHKNTPLIINAQTGTLNSDCLFTYKTKKLQLDKERSYENCDFLDSDDESSDLAKAYDEYETKEKIFNNCITMIRSAVKIALREKLEHATKEIEVEKNRLLLLKQLEEEESRENQSKAKKGKKKEKNKKKQSQKEEKEAKKLDEQKKKEEEERLKNERAEKEMKRREEQRKKAEELKKKKDEQLRKKREDQAKRDEIEAKARKQKEEQKKLKEEQRKLKEEEKKKKQLEKKKKQELKEQEMKEAEEEMKKKLEIDNNSINAAPQVESGVNQEGIKLGSEQVERRISLLNTQNVQPYMSLLDSLQGNNSESNTTSLLNMTGNLNERHEEKINHNTMPFNSSYVLNQPPPGLGMNDYSTPSPMMNPQSMLNSSGYVNASNSTPGSNSMLYNQTSPANTNPLGAMYGSVYNQQAYSTGHVSGYGMYGNGMMQSTMMPTPASAGTMSNEGEGMNETNNYMNYNQPNSNSVWNNNVSQQGPISSTMMSLAGGGFLNNNMNSYYSSLMGVYGNNNNKNPNNNDPHQ